MVSRNFNNKCLTAIFWIIIFLIQYILILSVCYLPEYKIKKLYFNSFFEIEEILPIIEICDSSYNFNIKVDLRNYLGLVIKEIFVKNIFSNPGSIKGVFIFSFFLTFNWSPEQMAYFLLLQDAFLLNEIELLKNLLHVDFLALNWEILGNLVLYDCFKFPKSLGLENNFISYYENIYLNLQDYELTSKNFSCSAATHIYSENYLGEKKYYLILTDKNGFLILSNFLKNCI